MERQWRPHRGERSESKDTESTEGEQVGIREARMQSREFENLSLASLHEFPLILANFGPTGINPRHATGQRDFGIAATRFLNSAIFSPS